MGMIEDQEMEERKRKKEWECCSRLGMPVHINKMSFMLCILLTGHFQTSSTLELYICV